MSDTVVTVISAKATIAFSSSSQLLSAFRTQKDLHHEILCNIYLHRGQDYISPSRRELQSISWFDDRWWTAFNLAIKLCVLVQKSCTNYAMGCNDGHTTSGRSLVIVRSERYGSDAMQAQRYAVKRYHASCGGKCTRKLQQPPQKGVNWSHWLTRAIEHGRVGIFRNVNA